MVFVLNIVTVEKVLVTVGDVTQVKFWACIQTLHDIVPYSDCAQFCVEVTFQACVRNVLSLSISRCCAIVTPFFVFFQRL
jgi:hypothetical protein